MTKCKICTKNLTNLQKKYCSRKCKYKASSIRMKRNNPMYNKDTAQKVSKTQKENIKNGFIPWMCTKKGKDIISK